MLCGKIWGDIATTFGWGERGGVEGVPPLCWVLPVDVCGGVGGSGCACLWGEFVFFALIAVSADGLPVVWGVCSSPACGYDVVCFGAVGVARVLVVEDNAAEWAVGDACLLVSCEHGVAEVLMSCGSCAAGGHCGHHLGVLFSRLRSRTFTAGSFPALQAAH